MFLRACLIILLLFSFSIANAQVYSLGVIPQWKSKEVLKRWQPVLDELKKQGIEFKFSSAPSIPEFEKRLLKGEYDFAYANPYQVLIGNRSQGYVPLVRDHSRGLKGILVVNKNSNVSDVKQLNDKKFMFPAPNALGASLLMRAELANKVGIKVNPNYVKTHSAVYRSVAFGTGAAGGGVLRTFNSQPDEIKSKLKIIYETTSVSPHPLMAHPRVPKADMEKIKSAFLEIGKSEQGQKILKGIPMKQIGEASMDDYKLLDELGLDKFAQ